ncbi:hypothetical protein OBBRIDRAFT_720382 [Obba rivulosa]|uniref:Nucleolus and neural progenitor protein-like N-terminal domain-containing protein n=1 Tax=Obba rivulosa TaxID=1052685 RepID=A0A8E2DTR8_9APHY|nr:hypothetical protein OBBRIDRAFT_720382 [Obba rivulosa]
MSARRFQPAPPLVLSARTSLDSVKYPDVDAALKQLKTCTRRLQVALSAHRNELQVLERLYYKGKNQHRPALFWKRVAEMRRYGDRIDGVNIYQLVENLRLSFWGDAGQENPKTLKRPWTHTPDAKSVSYVLRRCLDCRSLIHKTHERLVNAYGSFMLVMQTGAFLQLILTLAAIASRLDILLAESESSLEVALSACFRVLDVLDASRRFLIDTDLLT